MNFKKKVSGSWVDAPYYLKGTDTETITTLPAIIYPLAQTAAIGLKGQTVQSATPTPDNPIMPQGCGNMTGNLFDGNYTVAVMSVSGNTATLNTASSGRTAIVKCEPNTTYTVKKHSVSNRFIIAESDIKPVNGTAMSIIQNDSSISEYTFTTSNTTQYVAIYCSTSSEQAEPQLMLNTGSTALPYEPYGYKIPISSGSTTTPIYLGEVQTTRRIKKLVLTGEEDFATGSVIGQMRIPLTGAIDSLGYCTHYILKTTYGGAFPYIRIRSNTLWFEISPDGYETKEEAVADFKSYLAAQYAAGTPVIVWYVLATPETGIVNEPLCKIGDYADEVSGISIPTIAGANTLSIGTTLQPSEVSVNYKGWHPVADVHEYVGGGTNLWDIGDVNINVGNSFKTIDVYQPVGNYTIIFDYESSGGKNGKIVVFDDNDTTYQITFYGTTGIILDIPNMSIKQIRFFAYTGNYGKHTATFSNINLLKKGQWD